MRCRQALDADPPRDLESCRVQRGRQIPHAGPNVSAARAQRVEAVIAEMENSPLRGLGGAGFPTGRKWKIVRAEPAPRLMAVNIDEGEPGTFKDRYYLERDPHRFLEGMLIAAWAVGIADIYIYLRDEYAGCRAVLEREIAALEADPPCPLPALHLRRGAGAYICGEESAMIESIEGKRGMPRLRRRMSRRWDSSTGRRSNTTWKRSTGCARSSSGAPRGSPARAATAARAALVLGLGPGRQAGRASRRRPGSPCAS